MKTMGRIALDSPAVSAEARLSRLDDGAARIETPAGPWHNAVGFPVSVDGAESLLALVEGRRGEVDVNLLAEDGSTSVSRGTVVTAGETRLVTASVDPAKPPARWLMIRNGAREGASECDLHAVFTGSVPTIELTDDEATLALRDPAAARKHGVRRVWPEDIIALFGARDLPLRVAPPRAPFRMPPAEELWHEATDAVVLGVAEDLVALLRDFEPEALESHVALLATDAMRAYLRMTVVRVVRLVELLQRRGKEQGAVLEVGSWFGSFALALRRLGYDVVACDRYSSYGNAFDGNVALMRGTGIEVVPTTRQDELDQISALGQFDVVLAAAVIEHVPHTPRPLLERLFAATRPGGLLVLDTPNVARYWNRRALERGETIFQPLEDQYGCEPPWEGHHREFTGGELKWMLENVGCEDVEVEFFDYNMLQFNELTREHTECLAKIVEDPTQSDMLLATGRRPASARDSERDQ
jgi:SAM-dependent methyltransferase